MDIHVLTLGVLDTNVYVLEQQNRLIVIDPAAEPEKIIGLAEKLNKPITHVLITHGHFDHCGAAAELARHGAKIYISKTDYNMIQNGLDLARYCDSELEPFTPNFIEETSGIDDIGAEVIHTPGHTAGSLTFVFGTDIFSGDVLFHLGVGRSDLPTGNGSDLVKSVKRLFELNGTVHPGHGIATTIEFERAHNRYVKA